jgi:processive 1,2-diacylglycerol beta-glucosyltransferase
VLTLPVGGGHASAANAIALGLHPLASRIEVIDLAAELSRALPLDKIFSKSYSFCATWQGGVLHSIIYKLADRHPRFVARLIRLAFGWRIRSWLRSLEPVDAFISTYSIISYLLEPSVRDPERAPVISFVTDAGRINRLWFSSTVDKFILSDNETRAFARDLDVSADRLAIAPPPIFGELVRPNKVDARKQLGLDSRFTVLVTAGSAGLSWKIVEVAQLLADSQLDLQVILNAGNNKKLYRRLQRAAMGTDFRVIGHTPNLTLFLVACDVVIGKAGWMTLNEAMALSRPTIIVDALPGQEVQNCRYAINAGAARKAEPIEALELLARYKQSGDALFEDFDLHITSEFTWPERLRGIVSNYLSPMREPIA